MRKWTAILGLAIMAAAWSGTAHADGPTPVRGMQVVGGAKGCAGDGNVVGIPGAGSTIPVQAGTWYVINGSEVATGGGATFFVEFFAEDTILAASDPRRVGYDDGLAPRRAGEVPPDATFAVVCLYSSRGEVRVNDVHLLAPAEFCYVDGYAAEPEATPCG